MVSPALRLLLPLAAAALLTALSACQAGVRGGRYTVHDTAGARRIELAEMVDRLADHDVVFLGEEHDNDVGHRLQLWTTRMLHARRHDLVLSLEQFEADVQESLDLYLAGTIDEETFLASARPWGNYDEHYRPAVEWAKKRGLPVLAANIPRPLARTVSRRGYDDVAGERFAPWGLHVDEAAYRELFAQAMGGHGALEDAQLDLWFAAQCVKDDMMAESIACALERAAPARPLVVHWCGKFHSDRGLGTVSRLLRRRPGLKVAVVSMSSGRISRPLDADELAAGDFLWRVPAQ